MFDSMCLWGFCCFFCLKLISFSLLTDPGKITSYLQS